MSNPLLAKDLRIGNYIASGVNGVFRSDLMTIGKVLEIGNEDRKFEQIYCECEESFEWFLKDNYFGIPLNKEFLLKVGFEKEDDYLELQINENLSIIYIGFLAIMIDGVIVFINNTNSKFLHQLQNLYWVLSGEELTI